MKKLLIILPLLFLIAQPVQATAPTFAFYNHGLYTAQPWQAWEPVFFDGMKDAVVDGVTTYSAGQFITTPNVLLHISGRCMLYGTPSYFASRLAVTYAGNLYPAYLPLAFGDDRTVVFDYTFFAGTSFVLQLYYDGIPNSSVICNVLIEAVQ